MTQGERAEALRVLRTAIAELGESVVASKLFRKGSGGTIITSCAPNGAGETRRQPKTYTVSAVRQVSRDRYPGNPDHLLAAALDVFGETIACPCTGRVQTFRDCIHIFSQPVPRGGLDLELWLSCQTCPNRKNAGVL